MKKKKQKKKSSRAELTLSILLSVEGRQGCGVSYLIDVNYTICRLQSGPPQTLAGELLFDHCG